MNALITVLWWVLAGTVAVVVTLLAWFFAPGRTRAALIHATGQKGSPGGRLVHAAHGWLTYTTPVKTITTRTTTTTRPAKPTPDPAPVPPPPPPPPPPPVDPTQTEPPADGTDNPDQQPAATSTPQETAMPATTTPTTKGGDAAAFETLDGTVGYLADSASVIEGQIAEVTDQITEIDAQLAVVNPRIAMLSKLAEALPHSLVGHTCHAALVHIADVIGSDHAKELLEAKELLVAHRNRLKEVFEATTAAHREFQDYQKENAETRHSDSTNYQTAH